MLKKFESEGKTMMENISKLFGLVSETTAQKGIPVLEKELFECNSSFNKHLQNLGMLQNQSLLMFVMIFNSLI